MPIAGKSCQAFPLGNGAPVTGTLAGKASSPEGRSLSYAAVTQPQFGTVSLAADGAYSYTRSAPGRGDVDSFVYRVTDSAGLTAEQTATVIYGKRRIMPLGDSITDGVEGDFPETLPLSDFRVGYRKPLFDRLQSAGYEVDFVGTLKAGTLAGLSDPDHEGHSGAGQATLVSGIDGWLAQSNPDVVLLHIGTNDVTTSTSAAPTSTLLAKVNARTQNPANPPIRLLLATIIGQRLDTTTPSKVSQFNTNLQSMYNTNWADSTTHPRFVANLVDMNSKLVIPSDLSDPVTDPVGLHPSKAGYAKMADAWFEYLETTGAVSKCD